MIEPKPLEALLAADPLLPMQAAIVERLKTLLPGVSIARHPGKVDVSELIAKSVVNAPGVGVGWSRIRTVALSDGSVSLAAEWVAYIVAEARPVAERRVEKEAIALAIGGRILHILADAETALWGLTGILLPETTPAPELKPLFTVRDASQGVAYYTVTWTQVIADTGWTAFPTAPGHYEEAGNLIRFSDDAALASVQRYLAVDLNDA